MRFVIQRVSRASVTVDGRVLGRIERGLLFLIGIAQDDSREIADQMLKKAMSLRIFEDGNGKTNLSLSDVSGSCLMVSQFTLYADCRKGNRPSFTGAGAPDMARELYEYIVERARDYTEDVEQGEFGADMKVELLNDGPFTILLDSEEIVKKH